MKYDDFASVVQLGVGLHAGTALLQIYGEIGVAPLVRKLARIRKLVQAAVPAVPDTADALEELEADFDIFRIQLFNEFKKYVVINFVVAAVLIVILIIISYNADNTIPDVLAFLFLCASILPAPITLGILWVDASRQVKPLEDKAERLQRIALGVQFPPQPRSRN